MRAEIKEAHGLVLRSGLRSYKTEGYLDISSDYIAFHVYVEHL